jgi:propionyl-CoA synthetase
VGPIAKLEGVIIVEKLPKTRSGKILRGTIKKIANREEYKMPATIDDPTTLDMIKQCCEAWLTSIGKGLN